MKNLFTLLTLCGLGLCLVGCTDQEDVVDEVNEAEAARMDATADGMVTEDEMDDVQDETEEANDAREEVMEGDVVDGEGILDGSSVEEEVGGDF